MVGCSHLIKLKSKKTAKIFSPKFGTIQLIRFTLIKTLTQMAKRDISTDDGGRLKSPGYLKGTEQEFSRIMVDMIGLMGRLYKNQVIEWLSKGTIEKFEDEQVGNFASVFTNQSARIEKKLLKRFSNNRLKDFTTGVLNKSNDRNKKIFYDRLEKEVGIPSSELIATEGLKPTTNALMQESIEWAQNLRDETLGKFSADTLREMSLGKSIDDVLANFSGLVSKRKNHAKFIARNQVATFTSLMTKVRAQNVGITEALWVTSRDEKVRKCHRVRDGKLFDLSKGLFSSCDGLTLLPGVDYNCRCDYILIIPKTGD